MIAASWAPIDVCGRSSPSPAPPPAGAPPKPAKRMLPTERFIAVAISIVRIVPEEPTRVPATISATLSSAKPAAAAERPVKALSSEITTGMSAPPIGSTTRLPSSAAAIRIAMNSPWLGSPLLTAMSTQAATIPISSTRVDHLLAGDGERPGRDQVLELGEGDVRAPEGDRADDRGEEDRDQHVERDEPSPSRDPVADLRPGDQRHGAAADAVVEGDHLRHLGHLHADRGDDADRRADPEADRDQAPVADPVEQQRRDDGDRHADGGDQVAALGGGRVGALFDPDDEQREGDDVERRGGVAARLQHCLDHLAVPVLLRASASWRTCRASGR